MLEHSVYSVISPEGCASILYRDSEKAPAAAAALKLTAQDLIKFNIIDEIIEEPLGGAHRDPSATIKSVGDRLKSALLALSDVANLKSHRNKKFLNLCRNHQ
jgi:acetyl-CoA carboxylase carboxyl transferase subunit alpha